MKVCFIGIGSMGVRQAANLLTGTADAKSIRDLARLYM